MSVQEFYSAQFANNKATNNKTNLLNKILREIFQQYITPAVEKGKFSCDIPDSSLTEDAIVALKELNYNVKLNQTGYNEYDYTISW